MMDEDNQCSLDGLDEQNKLIIDCLPAEVLAICLSYTGEDLPNTRLTCRRFNQIIEDYEYMMNVIPVDFVSIKPSQTFLNSQLVTLKFGMIGGSEITCELDQVMQYVRFLRPQWLDIGEHLEATIMKKYLTESWRKGIVKLDSYEPLLSIFPNVDDLGFHYSDPSVVPLLLAQISAHPSLIRRFMLDSLDPNDREDDDLILDVLSKNSNKFNGGMEYFGCFNASCSMEAIIRFLENSKFAEEFRMSTWVKNYNVLRFDPDEGDSVYVENSGYEKFNNWLSSKGIPRDFMQRYDEFVYRSTQFNLYFYASQL